jgi:hypothetical protein
LLSRQLKAIGHEPAEDEISDIILLRLDQSFTAVRSALVTRATYPTLQEIVSAVKEHEAREAVVVAATSPAVKTDNSEPDMAFYTGRGRKVTGGGSDFDWGNSKGADGACHHCGRLGHHAACCVADMPADIKRQYLSPNVAATVMASAPEETPNYAFFTFQ